MEWITRVALPKITDEIVEMFEGSGLIDNYQWTQDAVDFACLLQQQLIASKNDIGD